MAEMLTARLVEWDAEKGYGFLKVGSRNVFLHIRDFAEHRKVPEPGDMIRFTLGSDRVGRTCALKAVHSGIASPRLRRPDRFPNKGNRHKLGHFALLMILLVAPSLALYRLAWPPAVTIVSAIAVSAITYLSYALDKMRAQSRDWRISEATLQFLALVGGWPGAFLAQQQIRHKTAKTSFQIVFWLTVLLYQFVAIDFLIGWEIWRFLWATGTRWLGH